MATARKSPGAELAGCDEQGFSEVLRAAQKLPSPHVC